MRAPSRPSRFAPVAAAVRRAPVSVAVAALTVVTSAGEIVPGVRAVVAGLTHYRGVHLARGWVWQLVLSAFAAQSVIQLIWTVFVVGTVFVTVERRMGSEALLGISLSAHLVSTLLTDLVAYQRGWHSWLFQLDFGTSCLIAGAFTALLLLTRSRLLGVAMMLVLVGDGLLNSAMTVLEHLISIATAAVIYAAITRHRRRRRRVGAGDAPPDSC